jgi:hypothetical protein
MLSMRPKTFVIWEKNITNMTKYNKNQNSQIFNTVNISDLKVPKFVFKDKGINFTRECRGLNIMLHVPSTNRPILKSRGLHTALKNTRKNPINQWKNIRQIKIQQLAAKATTISSHTTKRTTYTWRVHGTSSKALVKSKYMTCIWCWVLTNGLCNQEKFQIIGGRLTVMKMCWKQLILNCK